MSNGPGPGDPEETVEIPLIDGALLGRLMFFLALDEIRRVPPANDLGPGPA